MHRVLIAGVSTRAAAESAAKAGFEVTALDAYGDLDQHPSVRSLSLPRDVGQGFTASAAASAAREIACDAVAYLSPFENHPRAVKSLTASRVLWGNPPDVLRLVRDPFLLAGSLRRRGFSTPITRVDVTTEASEWVVKPFHSGGGRGVQRSRPGTRVPLGCYVQECIDGTSASIVFVAAAGRSVPLGVSRQLVGDASFGASDYQYCGNVIVSAGDTALTDEVVEAATRLAAHVAETFGLVGLNGIDFIVRDGVPYPIEVNPRWCSSMELVERLYGVSVFGMHAAACVGGVMPAFELARARAARRALGKAIVFAREDIVMGDTRPWLEDDTIRDVPKRGEHIGAGQPICTVFAAGANAGECYEALERRAARMYETLIPDP